MELFVNTNNVFVNHIVNDFVNDFANDINDKNVFVNHFVNKPKPLGDEIVKITKLSIKLRI